MNPQKYLQALSAGAEITLPDGLQVRVRPVDSRILLSGEYNDELMGIVNRHILGMPGEKGEGGADAARDELQQQLEDHMEFQKFAELIAKHCIVYPTLVEGDPQSDDEFPISAFSTVNLMFLPKLIDLPLVELARFCQEQNQLMERILNGESDLPATEPVDRSADDNPKPNGRKRIPADQRVVDLP